jgi:hypothetical protein
MQGAVNVTKLPPTLVICNPQPVAGQENGCEPAEAERDDGEHPAEDEPEPQPEECTAAAEDEPKGMQGAVNVTKLPPTPYKPLPNEHRPNLTGSGRAGKPQRRFRMRSKEGGEWKEGHASELSKAFGVTPSQIYQWAGGKRSLQYDIESL